MKVLDPHAAASHHARLNRLALSLCGSASLADDLTQETYMRVLSRSRRLRGPSGEFPYLARTLRNVLNDHRRAQRREPALVSDELLADQPQIRADGDPLVAARAAEVYAAIAALPEPLRDVVAAVDLGGLSYAEAAASLRIPVGTVMSRLYRARARLAGALEDTERTLPT
jgi:RNA polymerase sigma-70 factor (ECF subfamily)